MYLRFIWRSWPLIIVVLLCHTTPENFFKEASSDLSNLIARRPLVYSCHYCEPPGGFLSKKVVEFITFITALNEGRNGLATLHSEMPDLRNPYAKYEEDLNRVWEGTLHDKPMQSPERPQNTP